MDNSEQESGSMESDTRDENRMSDALVGANFARLRNEANMSMDLLAAHMRDKGYRWAKSTVYGIEHGTRALKFAEAHDALECLGLDSNVAMARLAARDDQQQVRELVESVEDSAESLRNSLADFSRVAALAASSQMSASTKEAMSGLAESIQARMAASLSSLSSDVLQEAIQSLSQSFKVKIPSVWPGMKAHSMSTMLSDAPVFSSGHAVVNRQETREGDEADGNDGEDKRDLEEKAGTAD